MNVDQVKTTGVIGAGTMGAAIAQLAAQAGCNAILYDIKEDALENGKASIHKNLDGALKRNKIDENQKHAILDRITFTNYFNVVKADFLIEAVVEDLAVKQQVFNDLHAQNANDAIFATNTSSIPISRIANGITNPERVIGMHFFNPAHIMKLVEVISGVDTSQEVSDLTYNFAKLMGKKPVHAKDAPGFIVNRVARNFYVEGLKIAEENVANYKAIDELIEATGFKMGPFRLMDLIGVDSNFNVTQTMYNAFHQDPKFRPSRLQEKMKDAGYHGRKTGKGFYNYEN